MCNKKNKTKYLLTIASSVVLTIPLLAMAQFNPLPAGANVPSASAMSITANTMSWILGLVGFIAIIAFAIAGILYLVAAGDEGMLRQAKRAMKFSIIGVIVAISGLVFLEVGKIKDWAANRNYYESATSATGGKNRNVSSDMAAPERNFPVAINLPSDDKPENETTIVQTDPAEEKNKFPIGNPRENGEVRKEELSVSNVELVSLNDTKNVLLTGKGLSSTPVYIYIYSDLPMILSTVTDSNGNWSYVLDKQLADGQHEVYVVVTDNTGKITAKSEPLFFVKTAEAITVIPSAEASALNKAASPVEKRKAVDILMLFIIIFSGFVGALAIIGFFIARKNQKNKDLANQ
ncbi:MAG: Ig-like domain-containing protein [Patescibacteria group bacterium]